jgi:hypothetical protein
MECQCQWNFPHIPAMSLSSKPKKIKAKGGFKELKIVHTVSRKGYDALKTEEVKTPRRGAANGPSTSRLSHVSASPAKRQKMDGFDEEPILLNLDGPDTLVKRQTLVLLSSTPSYLFFHNILIESKRLVESILRSREYLFKSPSRPRNAPDRLNLQYLWHPRRAIPMLGLLWPSLVVPEMHYQIPHTPPFPSTPRVEGRILRKYFPM